MFSPDQRPVPVADCGEAGRRGQSAGARPGRAAVPLSRYRSPPGEGVQCDGGAAVAAAAAVLGRHRRRAPPASLARPTVQEFRYRAGRQAVVGRGVPCPV